MQISHVDVVPVQLHLNIPYHAAYQKGVPASSLDVVFIRIETRDGLNAWGCAAFDPSLTGETLESVQHACQNCADRSLSLNPLNTAFALSELAPLCDGAPSALCAFDIAFHDLLGLATGQPLHRLLGGYRDRIRTSVNIALSDVKDSVDLARQRVKQGFHILKLKGGADANLDVERVRAIRAALPHTTLRLDADGEYSSEQAVHVARALEGCLDLFEQPIAVEAGLSELRSVTDHSPVPILASQSVTGPESALEIASQHAADGISIKLSTCGGFSPAHQMDSIARAAHLTTMVSSLQEPALLIAAGLAFALSSPAVGYGDLDGHIDLSDDPTHPGFLMQEGELIARDVPGLGCTINL